MRLVVTENITLDGVVGSLEEWFDPAGGREADQADLRAVLYDHVETQDALLVGRVTFEAFRAYWPRQTDDATGVTAHLNAVRKYVVSRTLEDPGWQNTSILRGTLEHEVTALKQAPGHDLGVTGSISVVHSLIAAGLVDEYRLFVYPVVLGHGERLFAPEAEIGRLRLREAKPFRSGVVLMSYEVA